MLSSVQVGETITHNGQLCTVNDIEIHETETDRTIIITVTSYQTLIEKLADPSVSEDEKTKILQELNRRLKKENVFDEEKNSEDVEINQSCTGDYNDKKEKNVPNSSLFSRLLKFFSFDSCFSQDDTITKDDNYDKSEKPFDNSERKLIFEDKDLTNDEKVQLYFAYGLLKVAVNTNGVSAFNEINKIVSIYPILKDRISEMFYKILFKILSSPINDRQAESRLFAALRYIYLFEFTDFYLIYFLNILTTHIKSTNKHIRCAASNAFIKCFTAYINCFIKDEIAQNLEQIYEMVVNHNEYKKRETERKSKYAKPRPPQQTPKPWQNREMKLKKMGTQKSGVKRQIQEWTNELSNIDKAKGERIETLKELIPKKQKELRQLEELHLVTAVCYKLWKAEFLKHRFDDENYTAKDIVEQFVSMQNVSERFIFWKEIDTKLESNETRTPGSTTNELVMAIANWKAILEMSDFQRIPIDDLVDFNEDD